MSHPLRPPLPQKNAGHFEDMRMHFKKKKKPSSILKIACHKLTVGRNQLHDFPESLPIGQET